MRTLFVMRILSRRDLLSVERSRAFDRIQKIDSLELRATSTLSPVLSLKFSDGGANMHMIISTILISA